MLGGCRKTSICCVKLILRHCSVLHKYASFLRIACKQVSETARALHLNIFQQPPYKWYSDRLLVLIYEKAKQPSPFYCFLLSRAEPFFLFFILHISHYG